MATIDFDKWSAEQRPDTPAVVVKVRGLDIALTRTLPARVVLQVRRMDLSDGDNGTAAMDVLDEWVSVLRSLLENPGQVDDLLDAGLGIDELGQLAGLAIQLLSGVDGDDALAGLVPAAEEPAGDDEGKAPTADTSTT